MSQDDGLHARLRRLRRDVPRPHVASPLGSPETPAAPGAEGLPGWFRARLGARRRVAETPPSHVPTTVGPPADLVRREGPLGAWHERELLYPRDHVHGTWRLADVAHGSCADIARVTRDQALAAVELERACYLDIETTGLSGGAGTIPFLVALGSFDADGFRLWQGFLTGPEEEPALLAEVARRLRRHADLVSFFGKSFDRHRLEDKMRLHLLEPPFAALRHLDLYHPLTRLYRADLPDGRLGTMETALCGVRRPSDLSGRYAPEAWFDFLAERAHRLEAVFQHNADDVLSLVVLAAHLGRTWSETRPDGDALEGSPAARARALARLLLAEGDAEQALAWLERTPAGTTADDDELVELRAMALRKAGRSEEALAAWGRLVQAEGTVLVARARTERAKLLEHSVRDLPGALAETEAALRLPTLAERTRLELEHRADRLRRRSAASAPRGAEAGDG